MLAALIAWLYLGVVFALYGASALSLLGRWLRDPVGWQPGLPVVLMVGLALFGTFAAFLSLFMPLSGLSALLLLVGAVLLSVLARRWTLPRPRAVQWLPAVVALLVGLVVWQSAVQPPSNPDTNLYHAQTIHWIESFGAVPGLGNLNGRLAYNSDWLVLNAATSFAFLGLRSFHLIAGLLFLLAVFYFVEGLSGMARDPTLLSNWLKVLFVPLSAWTLTSEISSPGTDLPVILLTWVVLALTVEALEASRSGNAAGDSAGQLSPSRLVVIGILPAFIVTLKLSAAPLMLLSAWAFFRLLHGREHRAAWTQAAAVILILVPWVARSVIQSGYLVFPYSKLDIFTFDWKIPASYVDAVRNGVIGWARLPNKDWHVAVRMPLQAWLPAWFAEQTLNQRLMIVAGVLSPLVLVLREARRYVVPLLVSYIGVWFWVFSAPNLRFGYGFLLGAAALAAAAVVVVLVKWLRPANSSALTMAAGVSLALLLAFTLASGFDSAALRQHLLLPADYRQFRTEACAVGDLQISCAAAYKQCGYESFPCVPDVPAEVLPRGPALQDGFYSVR